VCVWAAGIPGSGRHRPASSDARSMRNLSAGATARTRVPEPLTDRFNGSASWRVNQTWITAR
jgi:hypothetical protein